MERLIFQYGIEGTWDLETSFKRDFKDKSHTPCIFDVGDEESTALIEININILS